MALLAPRLLFLLLLTAGVAAAQEVYIWTDGDGNPAYGDSPPPGADAQPVPLRYRRTDRQAMQEQAQRQGELESAARLRESQQAATQAAAEADRAELARLADENCRTARERVERYETAQRLFRPLPDGERQYLSDDELDAERAAARRAVTEWCNS